MLLKSSETNTLEDKSERLICFDIHVSSVITCFPFFMTPIYYYLSRDRTTTSNVMPNICIILYWHVRFISDNLFRRIIVLLSSSWHPETAELFSESSQRTPRGGESSSSACKHYLIFTSRLVFTPRLHLNNPD